MKQDQYIKDNPPERTPTLFDEQAYRVTIVQKISGLSKNTQSKISYDLLLEKHDDNLYKIWQKSNLKIDEGEDPAKLHTLYIEMSKAIDQLEFKLDKDFSIKELYNYEDIQKKWQELEPKLYKNYTGKIAYTCLGKMKNNISDYFTLIEDIYNDLVLQHIVRHSINDYLIYYGKTTKSIAIRGLLSNISLPFHRSQSLGLKGKDLHLQTQDKLDIEKLPIEKLNNYFKRIVPNFDIQNLNATITSDMELDYKSIWMKKASISHTIWVTQSNYKKEIQITLENKNHE